MKIRLWKLGSLEHRIFPTLDVMNRLRDFIKEGATDIIWGPDIECQVIDVDGADDVKDIMCMAEQDIPKNCVIHLQEKENNDNP